MTKRSKSRLVLALLIGALLLALGPQLAVAKKGGGGPPMGEATGNNLSYPVIWAEGVAKVLRGAPEMDPVLDGAWWYWWGTDEEGMPLSCAPDADDSTYCDDGELGTWGDPPGENAIRAYLQQDEWNEWQAESLDWTIFSDQKIVPHWIDWGDSIESVDWYLNSMVRTEVVLIENLGTPMLEYGMRHVSGWGQNEMHGVETSGETPSALELEGLQATIYSPCARLTIQKLLVNREELLPDDLTWVPTAGVVGGHWTGEDPETGDPLINPPIYNMAVHQGGDGPGYYSAEINIKGKIIFGYTWNVRKNNEGAADYRLTFSLDASCGDVTLNTDFVDGVTAILLPDPEESLLEAEEDPESGGVAQIDFGNDLTYIDVRIHESKGGGKKPKK